MKIKLDIRLYILSLLFAMVALLPACKKSNDSGAAPMITAVRNYVASPNDTVLHSALAKNQWVVIIGQNLQNATSISFDGVPASFNSGLFAPNSAVVQIPNIVFTQIDTTKLFTVTYKTPAGTTTFSFKLGAPPPVIATISNVFAIPGKDSLFLYGSNLGPIKSFSYGGVTIHYPNFRVSVAGDSVFFKMPVGQTNKLVILATPFGTARDTINATPVISSISNENANPGDSVWVVGNYLNGITSFSFAGVQIASYKITTFSNTTTTVVGFVMPSNAQPAPVIITTSFGTGKTVFNVQDRATGSIASFDYGIGNYGWEYYGGANITSGNSDFPGNSHSYAILQNNQLSPGEGNNYTNYSINIQSATWVPSANIGDPPSNWAVKFEVSVAKPWNGTTIAIRTDANNSKYIYRWEPWQITPTKTAAITTGGWITVTIPLSLFKAHDATLGDGEGLPLTNIADLTGAAGNKPQCYFEDSNYGSATSATGFYGAFGNIRVVKIK